MDLVTLSRFQFALTSIYHFLFVPLTLGLGWFIAYMQTRFYQTRNDEYGRMTKFWGRLFLINFAIGTVTGIVQEFQFGMNWSEYSRFVGDVFGVPIAIETFMAFFLESTFLGIWVFGEGRVPEKVHLASIWIVAIGGTLSAWWILIANGWMQHPVGYTIDRLTDRPVLNDFMALVTNPRGWIFFWHTVSASLLTASFVILGISAYHIARKSSLPIFKRSFQMAAIVGLICGVSVILSGDTQGKYVYKTQPMKMASIEALWWSEKPASYSLLTIGDLSGRKLVWEMRIPTVLSMISCNNTSCEVRGVYDMQYMYTMIYGSRNYIPLIVITYWTFRIMLIMGFLMTLLSFIFLLAARRTIESARWIKWVPLLIALPYIANINGWLLTEAGRQPWIVQGLLTVEEGVSPNLTVPELLFSLAGYFVIYGALAVVMFKLMRKYATAGLDEEMEEVVEMIPVPIGSDD